MADPENRFSPGVRGVSEFKSVATIADFRTLDESEVLLGYLEGFDGSPRPGSDCSRSFCHGWRNGMADAGHAEPDSAQMALSDAFYEMAHCAVH